MISGYQIYNIGRHKHQYRSLWTATFTPSSSSVTVWVGPYHPPFKFVLKEFCKWKKIKVEESYLLKICDKVGDMYRFGFNGQEKVNEISGIGNHNTALFWEYDTRTGRRWNLDPKPNPSISHYATFAGNSIMFSDVLGDTLDVGTSSGIEDIKSIAKNSGHINIKDGRVSLSFHSDQQKSDVLSLDPGLNLINKLVNSEDKYLYSTSENFNSEGILETKEEFVENGGNNEIYDFFSKRYLRNSWFGVRNGIETTQSRGSIFYKNASTTPYGRLFLDENQVEGNKIPTLLPSKGYNGQVNIA